MILNNSFNLIKGQKSNFLAFIEKLGMAPSKLKNSPFDNFFAVLSSTLKENPLPAKNKLNGPKINIPGLTKSDIQILKTKINQARTDSKNITDDLQNTLFTLVKSNKKSDSDIIPGLIKEEVAILENELNPEQIALKNTSTGKQNILKPVLPFKAETVNLKEKTIVNNKNENLINFEDNAPIEILIKRNEGQAFFQILKSEDKYVDASQNSLFKKILQEKPVVQEQIYSILKGIKYLTQKDNGIVEVHDSPNKMLLVLTKNEEGINVSSAKENKILINKTIQFAEKIINNEPIHKRFAQFNPVKQNGNITKSINTEVSLSKQEMFIVDPTTKISVDYINDDLIKTGKNIDNYLSGNHSKINVLNAEKNPSKLIIHKNITFAKNENVSIRNDISPKTTVEKFGVKSFKASANPKVVEILSQSLQKKNETPLNSQHLENASKTNGLDALLKRELNIKDNSIGLNQILKRSMIDNVQFSNKSVEKSQIKTNAGEIEKGKASQPSLLNNNVSAKNSIRENISNNGHKKGIKIINDKNSLSTENINLKDVAFSEKIKIVRNNPILKDDLKPAIEKIKLGHLDDLKISKTDITTPKNIQNQQTPKSTSDHNSINTHNDPLKAHITESDIPIKKEVAQDTTRDFINNNVVKSENSDKNNQTAGQQQFGAKNNCFSYQNQNLNNSEMDPNINKKSFTQVFEKIDKISMKSEDPQILDTENVLKPNLQTQAKPVNPVRQISSTILKFFDVQNQTFKQNQVVVDGGDLGELDFRFSHKNHTKSILIVVENDTAKAELQRILPAITESLNQKGANLSTINIEVGNQAAENEKNRDSKNNPNSQFSKHNMEGREDEESTLIKKRYYGYNTMDIVA